MNWVEMFYSEVTASFIGGARRQIETRVRVSVRACGAKRKLETLELEAKETICLLRHY